MFQNESEIRYNQDMWNHLRSIMDVVGFSDEVGAGCRQGWGRGGGRRGGVGKEREVRKGCAGKGGVGQERERMVGGWVRRGMGGVGKGGVGRIRRGGVGGVGQERGDYGGEWRAG